jgi:hypothetical protein
MNRPVYALSVLKHLSFETLIVKICHNYGSAVSPSVTQIMNDYITEEKVPCPNSDTDPRPSDY